MTNCPKCLEDIDWVVKEVRRDTIKELPVWELKKIIKKFILDEPWNKGDFNKTREVCWVWVRQIIDEWYKRLLGVDE